MTWTVVVLRVSRLRAIAPKTAFVAPNTAVINNEDFEHGLDIRYDLGFVEMPYDY